MKREIKFRVWNNEQKKFEYFDLNNITVPDRMLSQHSYPVQQFTEIVTETEKEIYEGDIVTYHSKVNDTAPRHGEVYWCDYHNGWAVKDSKCYPESDFGVEQMNSPFMTFCEPEVIGNILENPELLK